MSENLKVKIVKVSSDAVIPKRAKKGDAAYDLTAISIDIVDKDKYGYIEYDTGIALEIPNGYYGQIVPRSSISKTGMILANSPGTIDSGYRGTIKIRFKYINESIMYNIGDRVAQLMILPVPTIDFIEVEELSTSQRDDNGFGSTGK